MKAIIALLAMAAVAQCASEADEAKVPMLELTTGGGRTGAALGTEFSFQFNWKRFGVAGLYDRSSVSGYQSQGATANFSDGIPGARFEYRAYRFRKFTLSPFFQIGDDETNVRATYVDPGSGMTFVYREHDRAVLVAVGAKISYPIGKGMFANLSFGENLGNSTPAQTGGGILVAGSVSFDALRIVRGTEKLFK